MPTIKLTNLAAYRTYFQAIATSHVDIEGFKWGDTDVIRNDARNDLAKKFLWATPYEGTRYLDAFSDNIQKVKQARVAYMTKAESELFADEDAQFDFAEGVIEEIVAKILVDKRGALAGSEWSMLLTRISSITTAPVEKTLSSTRYIGYELTMEFQDPANLQYNPAKWA